MKHAGTSVGGIPRAPLRPPLRSLAVSWFGRIGPLVCVLAIAGIAAGDAWATGASVPADTLYGAMPERIGGRIVTVDQNAVSSAWLSTPKGGYSLPG